MNQLEQKAITSVEVAEMVGKDHNKLLRDIRGYVIQLGQSKIGHTEFFSVATYLNNQNKELPCFLVTKKGCEFIGNKLTGVKGTEFTAKYINRFHDMETALTQPKKLSALEQLQLQNQALLEVNDKVDEVKNDLEEFKQEMPLLGCDMDRITTAIRTKGIKCLGGKNTPAYKDKPLRSRVYSDIHTQLRREFGVSTYKSIKRNQVDKAVDIVNKYYLPYVLAVDIADANTKMAIA
jgi:Rha family phage regulatory protein|nr:Rha family transcriptional regulator [uncultured Lachnoclostridium sp.]